MKILMTVIFSLWFLVSCASVRTFDLVGVSGGSLIDDAVLAENDILRIKVLNYNNKYDVIAFSFMIRNKSNKYVKLDVKQFYLKDSVAGVRYPLTTKEAFKIVQSHKIFETDREKMKSRRQISSRGLRSGEIPPLAMVKGYVFFEPGRFKVKDVSLVIRGLSVDDRILDFQDIKFQDEDYVHRLRKMQAKRARAKAKRAKAKARAEAKKAKAEAEAEAEARAKEKQMEASPSPATEDVGGQNKTLEPTQTKPD